ncbi:MAG: hypothetical protein ACOZQL_11750 [Myxococcota bacterium]
MTNTPLSIPDGLQRAVESAYATPPRAYHSFAHVQEVLRHVATVSAGPGWAHPKEVFLAALFHDAVYVAGRSDNEAKSADLALQAIATYLPAERLDVALVRRLIELTARHGKLDRASLDDDARLFLDCDMAILGAAPDVFDAYDAAIATEYAHVPTFLFRLNRRRFLAHLLEAERIFLSDFFHARLDAQARANLRRAVNRA